MGVYAYCIGGTGHPAPPADLRGVDGLPVEARSVAPFVAWVSEADRPPAASLERVREHNTVVEAATEVETPLPLRFGQWFQSSAELAASLDSRQAPLAAGLERVAGALEFGVRILDPAHEMPDPDRSSGTAYLEGLARREEHATRGRARGEAVARELAEWLGDLVREERIRGMGVAEGLATVAHLVPRHNTGNYRQRVEQFQERNSGLRFVCTGPWPPYGFVDD